MKGRARSTTFLLIFNYVIRRDVLQIIYMHVLMKLGHFLKVLMQRLGYQVEELISPTPQQTTFLLSPPNQYEFKSDEGRHQPLYNRSYGQSIANTYIVCANASEIFLEEDLNRLIQFRQREGGKVVVMGRRRGEEEESNTYYHRMYVYEC